MDSGYRDKNGYVSVLSRSDDVINVAGHRLSAGALEEAILECSDVVEAAVIGVPDKLKGMVPMGLCVVKKGGGHHQHRQLHDHHHQHHHHYHHHHHSGRIAQVVECPPLDRKVRGSNPSHDTMALLLGRHYEFPKCGIIKGKLFFLLLFTVIIIIVIYHHHHHHHHRCCHHHPCHYQCKE
jgi:hypothetical protein